MEIEQMKMKLLLQNNSNHMNVSEFPFWEENLTYCRDYIPTSPDYKTVRKYGTCDAV